MPPEVTNKSQISRGAGVDRDMVRRYYDEIQSEMYPEELSV